MRPANRQRPQELDMLRSVPFSSSYNNWYFFLILKNMCCGFRLDPFSSRLAGSGSGKAKMTTAKEENETI
jgi:hypothetical protein